MPRTRSIYDIGHLYFVTHTIAGWTPIFEYERYAHIVMDSLCWLRENKYMELFAFCLMPDHLHDIVKPLKGNISELMQVFMSYTSHAILKELKKDKENPILLSLFREWGRIKKDRKHNIWQRFFDKNIYSRSRLIEKMEYIHNNPVNKGWQLVADRAEYKYSSACYYDRGRVPIIGIDDVSEYLR